MTLTTINLAALGDTINLSTEVTGTLPTGNGGTGSTATTFVNAASNVTGTLPVPNGGTGIASGTTDQILKFTGTTTIASAAQAAGGKLLQVVQQTKNSDSFTTGGYSTVFTCAITPSATNSKILVLANIQYNNYGNGTTNFPSGNIQLLTNSDATLCVAYGNTSGNVSGDSTDQHDSTLSLSALDSPNSTSAQTYKVSYKANSGRFGVMGASPNRSDGSSLTLIEIAA